MEEPTRKIGGEPAIIPRQQSAVDRNNPLPDTRFERMHHSFSLRGLAPAVWLASVFLLLEPSMASADFESEFIPFPEVTVHYNDRDTPRPPKQHGAEPLVDFFYTAKYDNKWRLLSEFIVSDDERDLERLIVGHVAGDGKQIWLGRNSNDIDQWNRLFHRETYLQTTVHRPGIIEFEDEGGVVPTHITGISIDDTQDINERTYNYGLTVGLGPTLKRKHLMPFDLLDINQGSHDLATTGYFSFHPLNENFEDSGVFASYASIPSEATGIQEIHQTVLGAYSNYTPVKDLVIRASVFYVANQLNLANDLKKNESFGYIYLQPEYNFNPIWTFYGRLEDSLGAKNDLYVQQIPSFITERALVGARYQLPNNQVVKLELAKLEQFGIRFLSTDIQWSAALP